MSGSGIGKSSRPEPILPLGEYGYLDWYWAGTTTCSTVQIESKPAASAAWANSTAAGPLLYLPRLACSAVRISFAGSCRGWHA